VHFHYHSTIIGNLPYPYYLLPLAIDHYDTNTTSTTYYYYYYYYY